MSLSTANYKYEYASWSDRIRQQIIFAPFIIFIYCYFFKSGILDSWAGCYYALQRTFAEILLSLRLIEIRVCKEKNHAGDRQPLD